MFINIFRVIVSFFIINCNRVAFIIEFVSLKIDDFDGWKVKRFKGSFRASHSAAQGLILGKMSLRIALKKGVAVA